MKVQIENYQSSVRIRTLAKNLVIRNTKNNTMKYNNRGFDKAKFMAFRPGNNFSRGELSSKSVKADSHVCHYVKRFTKS